MARQKAFIIDTGGIEPKSDDIILSQMRRQAQLAIDTANVIILVTDGKTGMVATDMDIAQMLMKSNKPIVLCVNKCDGIGEPTPEFMNSIISDSEILFRFHLFTDTARAICLTMCLNTLILQRTARMTAR